MVETGTIDMHTYILKQPGTCLENFTKKLKAMMAVMSLALFALITSPPAFARIKAEIDASANRAVARFYALKPQD